MAAGVPGRRRTTGRGGLRSLTRAAARGGGVAGGRGVDGRIRLLRFVFIVFLVLVAGRAVALAASSGNLTRMAREQQRSSVVLPGQRGAILDRNWNELAVGKPAQTVFATPYLLDDPKAAARFLCQALRITSKRERRTLEKALAQTKSGSGFAYVARKVDPMLAKAALALDLPGVGAYAEEKRSYPMKGSAAQVLGVVDIDGKGIGGVEMEFEKQLAGVSGSELIVRDPAGHALRTVRETPPTSGKTVRLTLDENIQSTAEDVLEHTVRSSGATAATAIVMDPRTGEILAMANVPKVEDNVFGPKPAFERNRCVTDQFEPGSIFKLVTISGALADGLVTPNTKYTLPPSLTRGGRTVSDAHRLGVVTYSVREILQHSSNVGAVTIGMEMKEKGLLHWMDAFGFAKLTGIDFPGEVAGTVPPAGTWSDSTIINVPMGQGIAVTPIQMAAAFSTVANNGVAVKPRLIAQVGDTVYDDVEEHRVISAKVAREVRSMLATAVAEGGTGTAAQIPGYEVAGKTGTAEKPLLDRSGYSTTDYVASFIGMVPADHPRLVVLVAVDSPRGPSHQGGVIAAPAVQRIMRFALQRLEIAP